MVESDIENLRNTEVLITGACGFIGINLIIELQNQGAVITALDLPNANWDKLPANLKYIKADILNKNDLKDAFTHIEIIFHLAARTDLDGKNVMDYRVNFEGTNNIIEEASKNVRLKRIVYYSTQLVVGLFNEKRFIDESEPYRTKTSYGESKIKGEQVIIKYCKQFSIPYTIIRPTSVYGPWGGTPYREFFSTIKRRMYFNIGKADNLVSWVYVKNLVQLTLLASTNEKAINEIYNGGDLYPYTMREIVDEVSGYYKINVKTIPNIIITPIAYLFGVLKHIGIKVPIYPFRLRNMKMNYCFGIKKSLNLGYNSHYGLKDGIKETLDWYEENNLI